MSAPVVSPNAFSLVACVNSGASGLLFSTFSGPLSKTLPSSLALL